jgi:hypothetical protein
LENIGDVSKFARTSIQDVIIRLNDISTAVKSDTTAFTLNTKFDKAGQDLILQAVSNVSPISCLSRLSFCVFRSLIRGN